MGDRARTDWQVVCKCGMVGRKERGQTDLTELVSHEAVKRITCAVQRHKMSVVKTGFSETEGRKGEN